MGYNIDVVALRIHLVDLASHAASQPPSHALIGDGHWPRLSEGRQALDL
jgi:hypothetical protein